MSNVLGSTVFFSSYGTPSIEKEKGVLRRVLLARVGDVKGHGLYADEVFTKSIVEDGQQYSQGVKARFGHPNMSSTTLGTYIGRFKNFRHEDGSAYADLYLDEVAKKSPKGDLYSYVLEMAEKNPDQFGNSIVFKPAKTVVKEFELEADSMLTEGDEIMERKEDGTLVVERSFARLEKLVASDLVDEGAATESLFEEGDFAFHATQFLDENPKMVELLQKHPDVVNGFMKKYNITKESKSINNNRMSDSNKSVVENLSAALSSLTQKFSAKTEVAEPVVEETPAEETTVVEDAVSVADVQALSQQVAEMQRAFESQMAQKDAVINQLTNERNELLAAETEVLGNEGVSPSEVTEKKSRFNGSPFAASHVERLEQKFNVKFVK